MTSWQKPPFAKPPQRPFSVVLVDDSEDPAEALSRRLALYEDEPGVRGKVVTRAVKVVPGVVRPVAFTVLYRVPPPKKWAKT